MDTPSDSIGRVGESGRKTAIDSVLTLSGVTKSFAGIQALKGVDFELRAGEVHALLGENGAGKSTLIKIISGVHSPDDGEMTIDGRKVTFSSPREAAQAGIATVYQELLLFRDLTVAENIYLGHAPKRRSGRLDWGAIRGGA
ncbi:MAG: rhamnose transport system ATP-binding protein, partial [Candidatus Hydrogenedentes bacterium]|nr:rhamnose transport system ATP-binding protein [Candidatus Hydrogenedentota bacterium]